jgi:hypothetical protein
VLKASYRERNRASRDVSGIVLSFH